MIKQTSVLAIKESEGTRIARENRTVCNKLTADQREYYLRRALTLIYRQAGKTSFLRSCSSTE